MSEFDYSARLSRARQLAGNAGLAGLIIGTGSQMRYLTGIDLDSHERLTALVVPAEGDAALVAPKTDLGGLSHPDLTPIAWSDGEDPYRACAEALGAGTVGLGSALTADHVLRLQSLLPDTVLAEAVLSSLFMAKEPAEVAELRAAGAAIDRVHARVPDLLSPGRTEEEVAADLDELIRAEHAEVDFIIVGSGPNGANPHHSFSGRMLAEGDVVVVDIGGVLDSGYRSDCTRMYTVGGTEDDDFLRAYDVLTAAHGAAVDAVRPGATAASIDAAAREVIEAAGFGENFFHRTGHGIGLDGHEAPYIIAGNYTAIEPGMTFSIEPGIYLPGRWGMRLEDIVTVTEDGCEMLNNGPRELR